MAACDGCTFSAVNQHWYDSTSNDISYFQQQISQAASQSGLPVFVGEFGFIGDDTEIASALTQAMAWMDGEDSVVGYAYYFLSDGFLLDGSKSYLLSLSREIRPTDHFLFFQPPQVPTVLHTWRRCRTRWRWNDWGRGQRISTVAEGKRFLEDVILCFVTSIAAASYVSCISIPQRHIQTSMFLVWSCCSTFRLGD